MSTHDDPKPGRDTQAVWAAEAGPFPYGAAVMPIVQAATFAYPDLDTWTAVATGKAPGHIYARNSSPTRVVSIRDSYGGTNVLFEEFLPRFSITTKLCDTTDFHAIEREIAAGCTLLYLETPTNPTLKVVDIARLAAVARRHGAIVVTDNTFATPVLCRPIEWGADIVVQSATKFLSGHGTVIGGVLVVMVVLAQVVVIVVVIVAMVVAMIAIVVVIVLLGAQRAGVAGGDGA